MEMIWLYVGNVSRNAQNAINSNGTLIHACITPSLWLVHIPVVEVGKVEGSEDTLFYHLPDNCIIYMHSYHSSDEAELDRAKDTIGWNHSVPEEILPLEDGDVIIDGDSKVTIYHEPIDTDWYREEERLTYKYIQEEILREKEMSNQQNQENENE